MTITVPAITARMGSREYFVTKMTAQALAGQVSIASELSDWHELTLNELYQRKLNEKRVEQEIAPYLATTSDRFFGSIIVWVLGDEVLTFEPVSRQIEVQRAYLHAASSLGFLIIDNSVAGQEAGLVALDGQHRLAALRRVVQGYEGGPHAGAVRSDEVAVIFVQDENVRSARDLFTVLNRSARRVSKNDVLIMSESDGAAIVARNLTSSTLFAPRGLLGSPLIKWEKNTIAQNDVEVTTLNALFEIVKIVARHLRVDLLEADEDGSVPDEIVLLQVERTCASWLETLFEASPEFSAMRGDPNEVVAMRKAGRYSLLMRPVGLQAFFYAVATLLDGESFGLNDVDKVIRDLLQLEWDMKNAFWRGILVNARGNVARKEQEWKLAGSLAAWVVASSFAKPQFQNSLLEQYRLQMGNGNLPLPSPKDDR